MLQQLAQFPGERRADVDHQSRRRVLKCQVVAVQKRSGDAPDGFAVIACVSNDRPAGSSKLMSNLVVSPGNQFQLQQGKPVSRCHGPKSGQGGFVASLCRDRNGQVAWQRNLSIDQCQVMFGCLAVHDYFTQAAGGCAAFADEDCSRSPDIQPVDRCNPKGFTTHPHKILHALHQVIIVAGSPVNSQTCRFVDDHAVPIFIEDLIGPNS